MKILFYGINYYPEKTGIGKYSGGLCEWLACQGHKVHVVTAKPYYPEWSRYFEYSTWSFEKSFINGVKVYRSPIYIPHKLTLARRLLHLSSFASSSLVNLIRNIFFKPDLVITVYPTLIVIFSTLLYAKLVNAKTVLHIQDFEVDAMQALGNGRENILFRILRSIEQYAFSKFDLISTISEEMVKMALDKGAQKERMALLPNWSTVLGRAPQEKVNELKASLGIEPEEKIVLYSGSLGEKQGIDLILKVARELEDQKIKIKFLVCGEGSGKKELVNEADSSGVFNLIFCPLIPDDVFATWLTMADCHLVIQKKLFSRIVFPSKLTNIMAVGGNAVITTDPETDLGRLCVKNIAIGAEPQSVLAIKEGILSGLNLPNYNHAAYEYAKENFDKESILKNFSAKLYELIKQA